MSKETPELKFIPSGSTLLNLALTGKPNDGWALGTISNIWGSSASGKTLIATESAAQFQKLSPSNKVFYLESESAFNENFAMNVGLDLDRFEHSGISTVEEMYKEVEEILEKNEGAFIIVDSLDALSSNQEMETAIDKGTMAMSKQKKLSEIFRRTVNLIGEKNAHLMTISQERDNVSGYGPASKRTGGRAIQFYCSQVVQLKRKEKLENKKTERTFGVICEAQVQKNRCGPPERVAVFPILYDSGIDDLVGVIHFLEKFKTTFKEIFPGFGSTSGWYTIPTFKNHKTDGKKWRKEEMIQKIFADEQLQKDFFEVAAELWDRIEEETKQHRPSKRLS